MSVDLIDIVPNETLFNILMNLPPFAIVDACRLKKRIAEFCYSEWFWEQYARSRGISIGNSKTWKEAVEKSTTSYIHLDLSQKLKKNLEGFAGDIEYSIDETNVNVIWRSGISFEAEEVERMKIHKFFFGHDSMDFIKVQVKKGSPVVKLWLKIHDKEAFKKYRNNLPSLLLKWLVKVRTTPLAKGEISFSKMLAEGWR